jgi:hypothetical protein
MANFQDPSTGHAYGILTLSQGQSGQVDLFGGGPNGEPLVVTVNDPKIATVTPSDGGGGNIRRFTLTSRMRGNVMVEARLGPGGPVWAYMQLAVDPVEPALLSQTDVLIKRFDAAIAKLKAAGDIRVFFTFAHAYITKKIRKHIGLFAAPNALLRLNASFATTFLQAIEGSPHAAWQSAFRVCSGLSTAATEGFVEYVMLAPVSFEVCGACMAKVHITRDLKDALLAVKGVDAQDYGNVLIFVMEGNLFAEVQIRGQARGALVLMTSMPIANKLNLDAKLWRNQVFKEVYGKDVPEPAPTFVSAYHKAEGR